MQADEYTVLSLLQPEASLHGAKAGGVHLPTISDSVHHSYFTHLITSQQDRTGKANLKKKHNALTSLYMQTQKDDAYYFSIMAP